jgi:hypothetical protein
MAEEKPIIRPVLNDDALIEAENKKHEERNRPSVCVQTQNGSMMKVEF